MSNLRVFSNPKLGEIRMVNIEKQPWFVGKDVAEILGYTNPSKAPPTREDVIQAFANLLDVAGEYLMERVKEEEDEQSH